MLKRAETMDSLAEKFDDHWEPHAKGSDFLSAFLDRTVWRTGGAKPASEDHPADEDAELLADLIGIDIERSWQWWKKEVQRTWEAGRAARTLPKPTVVPELLMRFAELPGMEDYDQLTQSFSLSRDTRRKIAQSECDARYHYGDSIGPPYFASRFGLEVEPPTDYSVVLVSRTLLPTEAEPDPRDYFLRGRSILGRQRSVDPTPRVCEERTLGNRLAIAPRWENIISREHLAIQLLSPDYAILTNISSKNNVEILGTDTEVRRRVLKPTESLLLDFPFVTEIGNVQTHFRCHRVRGRRPPAGSEGTQGAKQWEWPKPKSLFGPWPN